MGIKFKKLKNRKEKMVAFSQPSSFKNFYLTKRLLGRN